MMELVEWVNERLDELEELESKATDLMGIEIIQPGRIPRELIFSYVKANKRREVLVRRIERMKIQLRTALSEAKDLITSGQEWRIEPFFVTFIDNLMSQLRAAIGYLEKTNKELKEHEEKILEYKIKLNFNSPSFSYERRW